ncbi:MAG: hypothetical protein AAF600_19520 [Bacteroidota bacterium]
MNATNFLTRVGLNYKLQKKHSFYLKEVHRKEGIANILYKEGAHYLYGKGYLRHIYSRSQMNSLLYTKNWLLKISLFSGY